MSRRPEALRMPGRRAFGLRSWLRAAGNFSLIRHRRAAGHLVSMHQSGTHWLKFMLANALSAHHGLPPPQYNHANDIIAGPHDVPRYPALPHLLSSHSMPHPLLRYRAVHRRLELPPYVLLVRDLRAALVSNFEKWRARYGTSFSEYLRGDPSGRRYNSDLWWAIRFMNGWGEVRARVPARVTVVHYEALERDAEGELARVAAAFGLALDAAALAHGVRVSTREAMRAREDPMRPPGAVHATSPAPEDYFSEADRDFLAHVCARHLRHDFGYDYARW